MTKQINNEPELAEFLGVGSADRILKALFRATTCGICYSADGGGVTVAGYCEGVEGECPATRLAWPFTGDQFDAACKKADQDGVDMWNDTHGCDDCGPEGDTGYRSINPDCESCKGEGIVL